MLKKLLIAATAVVVGLMIVKFTTAGRLGRVAWSDVKVWCAGQVPLETRIKELRVLADDMDGPIKKARTRLVNLEWEKKRLAERRDALKTTQENRKKDMQVLLEGLEKNSTQVDFKNEVLSAEDAQIKLKTLTAVYQDGEETLKTLDRSYSLKSEQVGFADQRLSQLIGEKTKLVSKAEQLEAQVEHLRVKQLDGASEDTEKLVRDARELSSYIEGEISRKEIEIKVDAKHGLGPKDSPVTKQPSREETLKAARSVLSGSEKVVAGEKETEAPK